MIRTEISKHINILNGEFQYNGYVTIKAGGDLTPEQTVEIRQDIEAVVSYFEQKYRDNGEIKKLEFQPFMEDPGYFQDKDKPEDEDLPF